MPTAAAQALRKALDDRDAPGVGTALLDSLVLIPATKGDDGGLRPAGARQEDGTMEVVAFTDEALAKGWHQGISELMTVSGRDLVDAALSMQATLVRIDPGTAHGGFLERSALEALAEAPREAGDAPLEAAGDWATPELAAAVGDAVRPQESVAGAWLAERGGRKTVALDLTGKGEADTAIGAIVDALRAGLPEGTMVDFLLLEDDRRAEAQALGEPLGA